MADGNKETPSTTPKVLPDLIEIDGVQAIRSHTEGILAPAKEAEKRGISLQQWQDLLHMAKANTQHSGWIDSQFDFDKTGRIIAKSSLYLRNCIKLNRLPEKLIVNGGLDLAGCTHLMSLPMGLEIGTYLILDSCVELRELPANLYVPQFLSIELCLGLTGLPNGLEVGGDIYLSDLSDTIPSQVKADVHILKEMGRIGGQIIYKRPAISRNDSNSPEC